MEAQPCLCLFAFAFAIGEAVPVAQRLFCPILEYALCLAMLLLFVHARGVVCHVQAVFDGPES